MTVVELAVAALASDIPMLKNHIADFSDQDMMVRPVPTANHTAWQLGHVCSAEASMINMVAPGKVTPPPFADKFTKETSKIDDPKAFPTKSEILDAWTKIREQVVAWTKTLTPADLDKPGPEPMRQMVPTVGSLLALLPVHTAMHVGQIQVIRRKLGRPVMF